MSEEQINQPEGNKVDELEKRVAELTRTNGILKANISTLYRTAKAEISRKNDRISELQSELDNLIFKRLDMKQYMSNNNNQPHKQQLAQRGTFSNHESGAEKSG